MRTIDCFGGGHRAARRRRSRRRVIPRPALGLAVLLLGALPQGPALAGSGEWSGDSVPCSATALVKAIGRANANPDRKTTLDLRRSCTYRLSDIDNTDPDFGPNGLPLIVSRRLTINGHDAVIRRTATASPFRILEVGATGNLTVNDVTISGGDGSAGQTAAGVLNGGRLTMNGSEISDNVTTAPPGTGRNAGGAGLYNLSGATLSLDSVTITRNTGRGDFVDAGGLHNDGTATITRSVISKNQALPKLLGIGGGVDNEGVMRLSKSRVTDNLLRSSQTSAQGGGIGNNFGRLTVIDSRVSRNTVAGRNGALGGGIANGNELTVESSSITDNSVTASEAEAQVGGGGIFSSGVNGFAVATVRGSQIEDDTARCTGARCSAVGGGVYNAGPARMTIRATSIRDSTVRAGKGGEALGAGIFNGSPLTLADGSSVTRNTARAPGGTADGGGIFNGSPDADITDSTVIRNRPNNCAGPGTPIAGCTGGT